MASQSDNVSATTPNGSIPTCLVTGFLGSGKTTLLGEIARAQAGSRLVFLINEFAARDVDGRTLREQVSSPARVVPVPGGSIFCTCLATKFVETLGRLALDHAATPFDGLVIEASGVADPRAVRKLLRETGLNRSIDLRRVISVLDPGTLPRLIRTLPNMTAQLEAADTVMLNKTDLFTETQIAEAERIVRDINGHAELIRSTSGLPIPALFDRASSHAAEGELIGCQDPHFAKAVYEPDGPMLPERIRDAVQRAGDGLYRMKGTVPVAGGAVRVDVTPAATRIDPVPHGVALAGLAVIATPESLPSILDHLSAAQTAAHPGVVSA